MIEILQICVWKKKNFDFNFCPKDERCDPHFRRKNNLKVERVDPTTNAIVNVDFSSFDGSGYIWKDVNAWESINRTEEQRRRADWLLMSYRLR